MKCIMVRLDGNTFIDFSHDYYSRVAAVLSRTVIIDMLGKLLCTKIHEGERAIEVFNEYVMSQIGYAVDQHNHGKDEFDHDELVTANERDMILEYFVSCYKLNLPYVPDKGILKFMACVWHEDLEFAQASVCLVAEHHDHDYGTDTVEPGNPLRDPCEGNGDSGRYLSAVFK